MNENNSDMAEIIAFLDVATFDDGKIFRGGILVTDLKTYPLEFRVTSPISPSSLQAILYGGALKNYIYSELITLPLVKAIKKQPLFIFTKSKHILKMRSRIKFPVFYITEDKFNIQPHPKYKEEFQAHKEVIAKLNKNLLFEPFSRIQASLIEAQKQKIGDK